MSNNFVGNIPNADQDGLNLGVGVDKLNVLKNTDIGVLRNKKGKDRSKYKRTTMPDGTVVEEIKMNKNTGKKGLVDIQTDGVGLGNVGVKAGLGEKSQEDAVAFVDSIWGSKQAAGINANTRSKEVDKELEEFRAMRKKQLEEESQERNSKRVSR